MKHTLQISVSKKRMDTGVVGCRTITVRERLLRLLFGNKTRLTVIVPGDSVEQLAITEIPEGGAACEAV